MYNATIIVFRDQLRSVAPMCTLFVCVCAIVNLIWLNIPRVHTKQNLITFNLHLLIVFSSPQIIIPDHFPHLKRQIR